MEHLLYIRGRLKARYTFITSSDPQQARIGWTLLLSRLKMSKPTQRAQGPIQAQLASETGGLAQGPCS